MFRSLDHFLKNKNHNHIYNDPSPQCSTQDNSVHEKCLSSSENKLELTVQHSITDVTMRRTFTPITMSWFFFREEKQQSLMLAQACMWHEK